MEEMTGAGDGGLVRPSVQAADAEAIALTHYGRTVTATELGSNQDRNYLLTAPDGTRTVLRIDNPVFPQAAREAQFAALEAYRSAGVSAPRTLPGIDGALTQRATVGGEHYAVRLSEFATGSPMVDSGYFSPSVLRAFGELAADSVAALAGLSHPGLLRENPWDMREALDQTRLLAGAIADEELRARVLAVAEDAAAALAPSAEALPVQAIHGDLTDDNVTGVPGADGRLRPHTVLDLGDLSLGWRVAELAVTLASLLHHDGERPLRVLDTVRAFHARQPLSEAEALALWPLVQLRAALLVASGWRQLQIDGDNDYARERLAGERAIFEAATAYPLREMTEHVLVATWQLGKLEALPARETETPMVAGLGVAVLTDLGVEAEALNAGRWLEGQAAEDALLREALGSAPVAVQPYGQFRLTRARVNADRAAETFPLGTRLALADNESGEVRSPVSGLVRVAGEDSLELDLSGFVFRVAGVRPAVQVGGRVAAGDLLGEAQSATEGGLRVLTVSLFRADAPQPVPEFVSAERVPAWRRMCLDPARVLGIPGAAERDESGDEQRRREQIFASAQERYYEVPPQIERGWQHHLVDTTGRSYVDMVNNVTGLGHGHPGVADAISRQVRVLNTNSRFLYRGLAEYSERLLAMLPQGSGLDTVLLVNSGSEAVDLGIRLAQAATGRSTVVALREAYHGWTMASDAVTTSAYDNPNALANRPDWVAIADVPNRFRGTHRGADSGPKYVADLAAQLEELGAAGRAPAAFICESVLGNAGGVLLPEGYLVGVYERVRAAGGLCIADEVQVGFGRMGTSFWGFEQSGVLPDIITIAKPMGNGYPIGGVITTKAIADALSAQGQFFSSAGGSPVSAQVGIAVLNAMRDEGLQENARVVGDRLRAGFEALAERHPLIGPVHGTGLYLGVELVRDRETLEPAKEEAASVCERLRELGVIVLTTSERSNVLKVKPPLTLTPESADFVLAQLDRVLTEGW